VKVLGPPLSSHEPFPVGVGLVGSGLGCVYVWVEIVIFVFVYFCTAGILKMKMLRKSDIYEALCTVPAHRKY
jgi:hypothetical protein